MKKCIVLVLLLPLLCGCAPEETFERVYDELLLPAMAPMAQLNLQLPPEATQAVLSNEDEEKLYFCNGYTLTVTTLESGDLDRTLQNLCGYGQDVLTVLETAQGTHDRYDWVFTCAAEGGTQIGRGAVLDDGNYHYCVCVQADEAVSGSLDRAWDALFASMSLS